MNKDFSVLYKHKKLCWMLASIIGIGTNQYHPWIGVGKKTKKEILADRFSSLYPSLNQDELNILLSNKKAIQDIINQIDGKI